MAAKWLETLGSVAPTLATAFGGPLAGMAVSIAGKVFGLNNATQEDIQNIVVGSKPEDLLKLKIADNDLKLALKALDVKLVELDVQDRTSARGLFANATKLIGWVSVLTIAGFFSSIYYVLHGGIKGMDPEEVILVGTVIGYMAANTQQVYNYLFGSSDSSVKKNEILADAMKKNGN